MWWHAATPAAQALVPDRLRPGPRVTVAALIRYLDSPVGAYSEVLACPHLLAGALRRGVLARVHVPFIAVDSNASVHGGRAHWALPKALAAFADTEVNGDGWQVSATATPKGPWLPVRGRLGSAQVNGSGTTLSAVTTSKGKARLATVRVTVASRGELASWLLPGTHRGAVLKGRLLVGPSSPEQDQRVD